MTFAHYPGEPEEQTAEAVEALERELAGAADKKRAVDIQAELDRVRGVSSARKQTRIRGEVPVAEAGDE